MDRFHYSHMLRPTCTTLTLKDIPWEILVSGYPNSLAMSPFSSRLCCLLSYPTPWNVLLPYFLGTCRFTIVHHTTFSSVDTIHHPAKVEVVETAVASAHSFRQTAILS